MSTLENDKDVSDLVTTALATAEIHPAKATRILVLCQLVYKAAYRKGQRDQHEEEMKTLKESLGLEYFLNDHQGVKAP